MGVIALSTGGRLYLLIALLLVSLFLLALISALWASATLQVTFTLAESSVPHGDPVNLTIHAQQLCPLPIAPLRVTVAAPEGDETLRIVVPPMRRHKVLLHLFCPHVGQYEAGLTRVATEDVFGLFSFSANRNTRQETILVLPRTEKITPLQFSPGDYENELISRATEDLTSPSGVRAYQPGDSLKKIHWKLSLRKREPLSKTYDQPLRPDALILLDCMPPFAQEEPRAVQDRLCDLAASLCSMLMAEEAAVRMPLLGRMIEEITLGRGSVLSSVLASLARMGFTGITPLERVLELECQRMRRGGATVVLTSALTPGCVDCILRLRRLGPWVRVYLVTKTQTEMDVVLGQKLLQNDIELLYEDAP